MDMKRSPRLWTSFARFADRSNAVKRFSDLYREVRSGVLW